AALARAAPRLAPRRGRVRSAPQLARGGRILARVVSAPIPSDHSPRRGRLRIARIHGRRVETTRQRRHRCVATYQSPPRCSAHGPLDPVGRFMTTAPPHDLGPMPTDRSLKTVDERVIRAPSDRIFALAADVERWPDHLPHYRYVRFLERR